MQRTRAAIAGAAALISAMASAPGARADAMDVCFDEGLAEIQKARWAEACEVFTRCEAQHGVTLKTRYQLGRCQEAQGKYARAFEAYSDAARLSAQAGDPQRAEVARKRAAALEAKVARIRVNVSPAALKIEGLTVKRNGETLAREDYNRTLAVDPGDYLITAEAPGRKRVTRRIRGAAPSGSTKDVTIPPLAMGSGDDPAPDPGASEADGDAPIAAGAPDGGDAAGETEMNNKALFWVGLGLTIGGAIGVAGGGVLTGIEGEATDEAVAGFIGGGVLLAVGIPFLVIGGRSVPVGSAALTPWLAPTGGGVRIDF